MKVKDLMKNVTTLTEELRSALLSDETISSILKANVSRSQVQHGRFGPLHLGCWPALLPRPHPGLGCCDPCHPEAEGIGVLLSGAKTSGPLVSKCCLPGVRKDETGDDTYSRDSSPGAHPTPQTI